MGCSFVSRRLLGALQRLKRKPSYLWLLQALLAILVVPPIVVVVFSAFFTTGDSLPFENPAFTLQNLPYALGSAQTPGLIVNTAWFTAGTVIVSVTLAVAFAWFFERTNAPLRPLLLIMLLAPMSMPPIVTAMSWIMLANPSNGVFNLALRSIFGGQGPGPLNIYTLPGMIVVAGLGYTSVTYLLLSGVFSRIDPSLEEASRASGAGAFTTFRRVSLPLLSPAVLGATIVITINALESFEIPTILGRPANIQVFSTSIYYAVRPISGGLPHYGLASMQGLFILLVSLILISGYAFYVRRGSRFVSVTGRGYRPRLIDLGRWRSLPLLLAIGYFGLAVLVPLVVLVWTSLSPPYSTFSLDTLGKLNFSAYADLLSNETLVTAAKNTLIVATVVSTVAMLLSTWAAWQAARGHGGWSTLPDRLAFVVHGIPPIMLALSLLFIFVALPLPVYGTLLIIILAFTIVGLPSSTRIMGGAILQLHPELEEASYASGAGAGTTSLRILLPLLWPSFVRGVMLNFIRVLREATIPLILLSVGTQTLPASLWFLWVLQGNYRLAAAAGVVLVVAASLLALGIARGTMLQGERAAA